MDVTLHLKNILKGEDPRSILAGLAAGILGLKDHELRVLTVPQFYAGIRGSSLSDFNKEVLTKKSRGYLNNRESGLLLVRKFKSYGNKTVETPVNRMTLWRMLSKVTGQVKKVLVFFRNMAQVLKSKTGLSKSPSPTLNVAPPTVKVVSALKPVVGAEVPQRTTSQPREMVFVQSGRMQLRKWKDVVTGKLYDSPK